MNTIKHLKQLEACSPALKWVETQADQTPEALYNACPRGDWLLWYAGKIGVDRKLLVLATCACARTSLKYIPEEEEDRPRLAIEAAEAWAREAAAHREMADLVRGIISFELLEPR